VGRILPSNVGGDLAADLWEGTPLPAPTVTDSYGHAWRQLKRHFWRLLLVGFVLPALFSIPDWALSNAGDTGPLLSLAYNVLVMMPLGYGALWAYLRAARGEPPQVGDLFAPFQRAYLPSIASIILVAVLTMIGCLLLIVPGIIVAVRLSFVAFLVVDERLGPVDALKESWRRTAGHGWTILGAALLAIPIVLLGVLLLVVGVIPASIWTTLAYASLFAAVTAQGRRTSNLAAGMAAPGA
jgi:uncharacterized membrane protein